MTIQTRSFHIRDARAVTDDRRVTVAISSETPVRRGQFEEVLVHTGSAIDTEWLGSGRAPVLLNHDRNRQIGVVEKINLDARAGILRATVRFSRNSDADDVLADIRDGIRSSISIGYSIEDAEEDGRTLRVKRWRPVEVSVVSIPADMAVGVGRGAEQSNTRIQTMTTETKEAPAAQARQELTARDAAEIMALGHLHGMERDAMRAVEDNTSFADFAAKVRRSASGDTPLRNTNPATATQQREPFSLGNFLRGKVTGDWRGAEEEREISQEMSRTQRNNRGSVVPVEALATRAAMTTSAGAAALVSVEHRGDLYINSLRPASFALQAGATMLSGLASDVSIPRETAGPSASWVAESGTISEGNPAFDNVTLGANMLAARVSFTRKALLQGNPVLDDLLKRSINRQFASALDAAVIAGSGVGVEPEGIENITGINSFAAATAGAVTWDEVCSAWAAVMADDVQPDATMAWVAHPTIAQILRTTVKDAGSGQFILGDRPEMRDGEGLVAGTILGAPCFETTHGTDSILTLGKFSDVFVGQFGGVDFVLDEISQAANGEIVLWAYSFWDVSIRHAESFNTITGV